MTDQVYSTRHQDVDDDLIVKTEISVIDEHNASRKPDRIHGLRLFHRSSCISSSSSSIQIHPFSEGTKDPPLFPFLVHEAKRSIADTQAQMKLPIRSSLKVQEGLRNATGSSTWHEGPLVWVLTNHGQNWNVSAAYVHEKGPQIIYVSLDKMIVMLASRNVS